MTDLWFINHEFDHLIQHHGAMTLRNINLSQVVYPFSNALERVMKTFKGTKCRSSSSNLFRPLLTIFQTECTWK